MFTIINPDYKEKIINLLDGQQLMKLIHFNLTHIEPGKTEGNLLIQQKHLQQKGFVHGGTLATLADITAGFAAYTLVAEHEHVVTADLRISFLHPAQGERLEAIGWVLKKGKKLVFCESEIWCFQKEEKKMVVKSSSTMAII
jgi:uncharacterized protein (TIGR00369 family)